MLPPLTRYWTEEILLIPIILIRIVFIILTVFLVVTRVVVIFEQPVVIKTFIIVVWILISGWGRSPAQPRVCPALVSFPGLWVLGSLVSSVAWCSPTQCTMCWKWSKKSGSAIFSCSGSNIPCFFLILRMTVLGHIGAPGYLVTKLVTNLAIH